ncbi:MAG: hypothetical protein ABSH01_18420 [Terriglobia bacterium]|jgi:hypothetical protein
MNLPWPLYVVFIAAIFFAVLGLCLGASKHDHVTGLFFQGALAGVEASLAWWLAGSGSSLLTRLMFDIVVGFLSIAVLYQLLMLTLMLSDVRAKHLAKKGDA